MGILSVVRNKWLATGSQNAILNNFEEYYMIYHKKAYYILRSIYPFCPILSFQVFLLPHLDVPSGHMASK